MTTPACTNCGTAFGDGQAACPSCGTTVTTGNPADASEQLGGSFVWLCASMAQVTAVVGFVSSVLSIARPLWTAAGWGWSNLLLGIAGIGMSVVMFAVSTRLK